ncbi:MAG: hypothetical protein ACI9MR_002646 [Myxococcota bacterium]|jgi:hypothetical protein
MLLRPRRHGCFGVERQGAGGTGLGVAWASGQRMDEGAHREVVCRAGSAPKELLTNGAGLPEANRVQEGDACCGGVARAPRLSHLGVHCLEERRIVRGQLPSAVMLSTQNQLLVTNHCWSRFVTW